MSILPIDPLELLTDVQVEQRTHRPRESLRKDRRNGRGIPYLRWGRSVRYRASDVVAWMEANTVTPGESVPKGKPAPAALQPDPRWAAPHLRGGRPGLTRS